MLIAPVALAYYLAGRFILAKSFIASAACDGCEACVEQCPIQAVRMVDGRPFWSYRCESCMRCMNACPKRAIETAHGFILGAYVLVSLGLGWLVHPHLRPLVPDLYQEGALFGGLRFVLESLVVLVALLPLYRLLHRALRYRPLERLAVGTSLTHLRFWRRYRAPRIDQRPRHRA